jgi:uncharacterized protein (DUF2267 family)
LPGICWELRTLRDWLQIELAANLGAGLPLLVRGAYYDRYRPHDLPTSSRSLEDFLQRVAEEMKSTRPVNPEDATRSVFKVLARHVDLGQSAKVRDALPKQIQALWPEVLESSSSTKVGAADTVSTASARPVLFLAIQSLSGPIAFSALCGPTTAPREERVSDQDCQQ